MQHTVERPLVVVVICPAPKVADVSLVAELACPRLLCVYNCVIESDREQDKLFSVPLPRINRLPIPPYGFYCHGNDSGTAANPPGMGQVPAALAVASVAQARPSCTQAGPRVAPALGVLPSFDGAMTSVPDWNA